MSETPNTIAFHGYGFEPGAFRVVTAFSPDGRTASALFENLSVGVTESDSVTVQTQTITVRLPVKEGSGGGTFAQDIRGAVFSSGLATVRLLAQIGDQSVVADPREYLEPLNPLNGDVETARTEARKSMVELPEVAEGARQFCIRVGNVSSLDRSYQATLFLLVERGRSNSAQLWVDSLDVVMVSA